MLGSKLVVYLRKQFSTLLKQHVKLSRLVPVKSHPFMVTGVCKSIVMESVYNEALLLLLFIVMGS